MFTLKDKALCSDKPHRKHLRSQIELVIEKIFKVNTS